VLGAVDAGAITAIINRLSKTKPATFSFLPFWAFFRESVFLFFVTISVYKDKRYF
jgi:hypothetical protein